MFLFRTFETGELRTASRLHESRPQDMEIHDIKYHPRYMRGEAMVECKTGLDRRRIVADLGSTC